MHFQLTEVESRALFKPVFPSHISSSRLQEMLLKISDKKGPVCRNGACSPHPGDCKVEKLNLSL